MAFRGRYITSSTLCLSAEEGLQASTLVNIEKRIQFGPGIEQPMYETYSQVCQNYACLLPRFHGVDLNSKYRRGLTGKSACPDVSGDIMQKSRFRAWTRALCPE